MAADRIARLANAEARVAPLSREDFSRCSGVPHVQTETPKERSIVRQGQDPSLSRYSVIVNLGASDEITTLRASTLVGPGIVHRFQGGRTV